MQRLKLKKDIYCPGPKNKYGRRIVKVEKDTLFWLDSVANAREKKIVVCQRYEDITKYERKCYDCLVFPKEEFNNLFEVLYEI